MNAGYTFADLLAITRRVIRAFDAAEQRPWTLEATMIELMKQTGDLAKHVMMAEGYSLPDRERKALYEASKERIADELADILYQRNGLRAPALRPGDERPLARKGHALRLTGECPSAILVL
jgi:hypothetical protein